MPVPVSAIAPHQCGPSASQFQLFNFSLKFLASLSKMSLNIVLFEALFEYSFQTVVKDALSRNRIAVQLTQTRDPSLSECILVANMRPSFMLILGYDV